MSRNILTELAKALDESGTPYMIIGGQAVLVYGEPRLTRDIDVTLALTPEDLSRVLKIIARLKLKVLVEDPESFVRKNWVLPAFDEGSGFRIDFIFSWTPYEKEAIGRAKTFEILGYPVRFAAPEDVVIHKIISGRPRDIEDIRTIVRKQRLNIRIIEKWLRVFSQTLNVDYWSEFYRIYREERA